MASFGFSISDIVLLSNYAYTLYKSSKNAGAAFKSLTSDLNSLQSLLHTLNNECADARSSFQRSHSTQQLELKALLDDCNTDLRDVEKLLARFSSLESGQPRDNAFGKDTTVLGWHVNTGTFSRIENNTETHIITLAEIRAKLDEIHQDLRSGRRKIPPLDDTASFMALEDEILGDSITEPDVDIALEVSDWVDRVRYESFAPSPSRSRRYKPKTPSSQQKQSRHSMPASIKASEMNFLPRKSTNIASAPIFDLSMIPTSIATVVTCTYWFNNSSKTWHSSPAPSLKAQTKFPSTERIVEVPVPLFTGFGDLVQRINLRRYHQDPKDEETWTPEEIWVETKVPASSSDPYKIRYIGLGSRGVGYQENVVFALKRVEMPSPFTGTWCRKVQPENGFQPGCVTQ